MLARLTNGLFAAAGMAAFAQAPMLYRQYLQHLSGRLAQARADLAPVRDDARQRGLSIPDYLDRAAAEGGELTGTLVQGYRASFESLQRLEAAYGALREAGPLARPWVFFRHLQPEVLAGTLTDFSPGLPLSAEGGAYALAGILAGLGLLWALERPVHALRRRIGARRRDRETGPAARDEQAEERERA
jgi:hypothetical protein